MNKTVCVIGSNSFSGSDFIDLLLLETDYRVLGISRSQQKGPLFLRYLKNPEIAKFAFRKMDLNKDMDGIQNFLANEKPEYVVNFAAQSEVGPSWENPGQWFQTNAVALAEMANFLKDQPWLERYVHISSPEVYGTCESVLKENAPLDPSTPYAASKAAGDLMLFTLVKSYNFPLVMIRSTNVYGAYQQLFKIIPRTAIYLKLGQTINLHGGGRAVKSYIHIRDISRGELLAMEGGRLGEIYHLSPNKGITVRNVVKIICENMGKDFSKCTNDVAERLGQDKVYVIDSSKARKELGWAPKVTLKEGLLDVIQWVDEYWNEIQKQPLEYVYKP